MRDLVDGPLAFADPSLTNYLDTIVHLEEVHQHIGSELDHLGVKVGFALEVEPNHKILIVRISVQSDKISRSYGQSITCVGVVRELFICDLLVIFKD
jgi:hypothetical protein